MTTRIPKAIALVLLLLAFVLGGGLLFLTFIGAGSAQEVLRNLIAGIVWFLLPPVLFKFLFTDFYKKHWATIQIFVVACFGIIFCLAVLFRSNAQESTGQDDKDITNEDIVNAIIQSSKSEYALPHKLDDRTTLIDITAEPDAIRYHHTLSDIGSMQVSNETLKNGLIPIICNTDFAYSLFARNISVEYAYTIEKSSDTYLVSLSQKDCVK